MLPSPATTRRPKYQYGSYRSQDGAAAAAFQWSTLRARARVTNLGLGLLATFAVLSLLLNMNHYVFPLHNRSERVPDSIAATIERGSTSLNHLIMVPGHSIWTGTDAAKRLDEDNWILEPYQRGGGRVAAFFSHIARGAELALEDPRSLLVFSGGQTRRTSTTTEAESYLRLALASGVLKDSPRVTTEDHALDSYQNLLFSIARFHEFTGVYPSRITVVGYEMKNRRFTELHREAVRFSKSVFTYVGIDPEGEHGAVAQEGEKLNGYIPYSKDLYGCHSQLATKRKTRNPFSRFHPYHTSAPEMRDLLDWCPASYTTLYPGNLPWTHPP